MNEKAKALNKWSEKVGRQYLATLKNTPKVSDTRG